MFKIKKEFFAAVLLGLSVSLAACGDKALPAQSEAVVPDNNTILLPKEDTKLPEPSAPSSESVPDAANKEETTGDVDAPAVTLVPFKGMIENIFFHPLIAYPEKAFDGDSRAKSMYDWFVTADEFKRILQELYANQYILVDIHNTFEQKQVEGQLKLVKKTLMLPEGKKPVILSVDDPNYYTYMKENGTIHRLVLDAQNKVAAWTQFPGQAPVISYDNEIVPILEDFIAQHPDFSHNGARGILAVTGYNGVFGYDTHDKNSPTYEDDKKTASMIAERLKKLGWEFSSHSYSHPNISEISLERLQKDTASWKNEVESIIGNTDLYIYPYGGELKPSDPRLKYLIDDGFRVFFGVGPNSLFSVRSRYVSIDRLHMDGMLFDSENGKKFKLFDLQKIMDDVRITKIKTR